MGSPIAHFFKMMKYLALLVVFGAAVPLLRLRPRPTVDMVDTVVDTTVATGDMVDTTTARGRLMLRLLLLLSPRLMLRPTVDTMVDTLVDTTAATGDTVD